MGPLPKEGFIIHKKPNLAHKLLDPENPLLSTLGKKFAFEVAIGMNGKIWINARRTGDVLNIIKAFDCCERMNEKEVLDLCRKY